MKNTAAKTRVGMTKVARRMLRIKPKTFRRRGVVIHRRSFLLKDLGAKGRTKPEKMWASFQGTLHGWAKSAPESERRAAIMRSVSAEGVNATKSKLIQLFNVTVEPQTKRLARQDFEWLRAKYPPKVRR